VQTTRNSKSNTESQDLFKSPSKRELNTSQ